VSDDLYFTRLRWGHGRGVAKYHGRVVVLTAPPDILGLAIDELIYTPETAVAVVCEVGRPQRELRPNEIAACDALLKLTFAPPSGES
jgi:hypothetical protein